ncbi:hypothetical protein ACE6H2_019754 [Prunus campanulata]
MASLMLMLVSLSLIIFNLISLPLPSTAISSCNGRCKTLNDCAGQLICIKGKCNDNPDVGTHTCCKGGGSSPPDNWGASECDERFHNNTERVVTLSTGWFDKKNRCGKIIRITASNGKSVIARVVDECVMDVMQSMQGSRRVGTILLMALRLCGMLCN